MGQQVGKLKYSVARVGLAFRCAAPEQVGQRVALLGEAQRHRVEAVAIAGRPGAIGKHVAEVAAAARADLLGAQHAVAGIAQQLDVRVSVRLEKAGPAGAGIELGAGAEQRQAAEPAGVDAMLVVVQKHAAERRLGAVLQQHALLVGREAGDDVPALGIAGRGEVEGGHGVLRES